MKERPLIVTTELIPKILDGAKTQTRRVIKPQPFLRENNWWCWLPRQNTEIQWREIYDMKMLTDYCPYGQVGDRLWVRETHYRYGKWIKNGFTKLGKQKWTFKPPDKVDFQGEIRYYNNPPKEVKPNRYHELAWYKRPSIFMPHWASQITLEIAGIRVERLQEITVEDVWREGIAQGRFSLEHPKWMIIDQFKVLWNSLNAKREFPWESNPWVWVIEFRMSEVNYDTRRSY